MKGFKTEGIILKRRNFGEADRILTVFTFHQGKVTVLAKGVRKITSRRSGNVELLNRVTMFLYPGKQFLILTEASSIDTYQPIKDDLTLSTYAYHLIELVDKLTAENQENHGLYIHLVETLNKLVENPRQIFVRAFEVKILSLMGFFSFQDMEVKSRVGEILKSLEVLNWDEIGELKIEQAEALEMEQFLHLQIERVIEGSLKSQKFLKELKPG